MSTLTPQLRIQKTIQKIPLTGWYYRAFRGKSAFRFAGQQYEYFYHRKNRTWMNERTVEIPIAWRFLATANAENCLEIGNVLSHYFPTSHTVLDKYERAPGVINEDVVDYQPDRRFQAIVSISTLEHVGWDEQPRDPQKTLRAVDTMRAMLAPGGRMLVTLPLGYNPDMDALIEAGDLRFDHQHYLQRVTANNQWRETDWAHVRGSLYNRPFLSANALVVGISKN